MTGHAYTTSAKIAAHTGPFAGYAPNRDAMLRVMRKHRAAADHIDGELVPEALLTAAKSSWDEAVALGEQHGYRNAQASVLAPTGTIGLMMDCDTTGIEPDLALVKQKKLVGGGTMRIVNQTIPRALYRLGYTAEQATDVVEYIAEHNSVAEAPHLKAEHLPVFDTSMGDAAIQYMGHVRMMGAVQPFISGAISKTVNMPEEVTVEEVEQLFVEGWKLGLKAVAIYRNNCKVAQPLSAEKKATAPAEAPAVIPWSQKKRLPAVRPAKTISFSVGESEGYITAGEYPDDGIGEIFLKVSKQGSTLAGLMDAFSIAVSVGLQYGMPLANYVQKFVNMRFEPSGITNDKDIRFASSLMDYIFRRFSGDRVPAAGAARGARDQVHRGTQGRDRGRHRSGGVRHRAGAGSGRSRRGRAGPAAAHQPDGEAGGRSRSTHRAATRAAPRRSRPVSATSATAAAPPAAARSGSLEVTLRTGRGSTPGPFFAFRSRGAWSGGSSRRPDPGRIASRSPTADRIAGSNARRLPRSCSTVAAPDSTTSAHGCASAAARATASTPTPRSAASRSSGSPGKDVGVAFAVGEEAVRETLLHDDARSRRRWASARRGAGRGLQDVPGGLDGQANTGADPSTRRPQARARTASACAGAARGARRRARPRPARSAGEARARRASVAEAAGRSRGTAEWTW